MQGLIQLKPKQWTKLLDRLNQDHPKSVMILRYKMREVLGFTVREHRQWVDTSKDSIDYGMPHYTGHYDNFICLDFYNDQLETWFRLKYAEYL